MVLSRRGVLLLLLALGGASLWYDRPSGAARKLWALTGLGAPAPAEGGARSLQALVRNVTTDMDELVALVEDFLDAQDVALADLLRDRDGGRGRGETAAESEGRVGKEAFRAFLQDKARSSYASVERTLDYILGLYKFLFVVLVFDLLMPKGSARGGSGGGAGGGLRRRGSGGSARGDSESDLSFDLGSSGRSLSASKRKARAGGGAGAGAGDHGAEEKGKENLLTHRVSGAHDLAGSGSGGKHKSRRALGSPRGRGAASAAGSPASVIDFNTYR